MTRLKMIVAAALTTACLAAPALAQQNGGSALYLREYADPRALGAALVKEGNWVEAKEVLERAELEYPNDPRVLQLLAQTYVAIGRERAASGDNVEAVYFFERALSKDDQLGDAWLALGEARFAQGDLDGAIEALGKAELLGVAEAKPLMVRVRTVRAGRAVDLGQLDLAETHIQEALKRDRTDREALLVLGRLRLAQGRAQEAIAPLESAMADPRWRTQAQLLVGLAFEQLGRWEGAIANADKAATDPTWRAEADALRARAWYNWGLVAWEAADWVVAEQRFLKAMAFAPDWADPRYNAALARIEQGNGRGAEELLEPLYEAVPGRDDYRSALARTRHLIGQELAQQRRYAEALNVLRNAWELDPFQVDIMMSIARVEEARGAWEAALEAWETAIRVGGGRIDARRGAMRLLEERLNRPVDALAQAEAILAVAPDDDEARLRGARLTRQLGLATWKEGDYERAIRLLERHRELTTPDREVRYALADALTRRLRFALAAPLAESLYRDAPDDAAIIDLVFRVRAGLGDDAMLRHAWPSAASHYVSALQLRDRAHVVRLRLGRAWLEDGQYADATAALRRVWSEAPTLQARAARPLARALTGWAAQVLPAEPGRADELASEAIARDAGWAQAWFVRSKARYALGRLDDALEDAVAFHDRDERDLEGEQWLVRLLREGTEDALNNRRYRVAAERARRLLELRPDDPQGIFFLARALDLDGRFDEAVSWYERAAAGGPYRGQAYVWLARGFVARDDPEQAARYYLAAQRFDDYAASASEQIATFRKAAELARGRDDLEGVVRYLRYAFLLAPTDPQVAWEYGQALMAVDRPDAAVPHLRRAHEAWPERRDVAMLYARALIADDKPLNAMAVLETWEQPDKEGSDEARRLYGQAAARAAAQALERSDPQQAMVYARAAAVRLDPEPTPWYTLARILEGLGQTSAAIDAYEHLYGINPSWRDTAPRLARLYVKRGEEHLAQRNLPAATADFERAIEVHDLVDAWYGLVRIASAQQDPQRMLELADRVEQLQPGYRDVRRLRADALVMLGERALAGGRPEEALRQARKALELAPELATAHYLLGAARVAVKQFSQAIPALEAAREELGDDYLDLRALLSAAYAVEIESAVLRGDHERALALIERTLKLDPDQPDVLIWQGGIYEQRERFGRARAAYERALASDRLSPERRKLVEAMIANLPAD